MTLERSKNEQALKLSVDELDCNWVACMLEIRKAIGLTFSIYNESLRLLLHEAHSRLRQHSRSRWRLSAISKVGSCHPHLDSFG